MVKRNVQANRHLISPANKYFSLSDLTTMASQTLIKVNEKKITRINLDTGMHTVQVIRLATDYQKYSRAPQTAHEILLLNDTKEI